jgi:M6 family metalloprotease-like protein
MERSRLALLAAVSFALALPAAASADATVHGDDLARNREVAVAAPRATLAAQERVAAQTSAATSPRTLAVILVNFTNDASQPFTTAQARAAYFTASNSVNSYYSEQSSGQVTFTGRSRSDGDVFGWYQIASSNAGNCDWQTWGDQAQAAAKAAGNDTAPYDHVAIVFSHAPNCNWSGLGYQPGSLSYISGTLSLQTIAHEIGHNLGLWHASAGDCSDSNGRATIGTTCTRLEYGDPFDVMGSGPRLLNGFHRAQLGFLGSGTTRTVTTSGDYLLSPLLPTGGGDKVIRIARGDGTDYSLDFRQPFGTVFDTFGASDPVVNGVGLHLTTSPGQSLDNPMLLDATPSTSTFSDAALAVGATFVDTARGIQITTLSVSSTGATVRVTFGLTTGGTTGGTTAGSSGTTGGTTAGSSGTTGGTTAGSSGTTGGTTGGTTAGSSGTTGATTGGTTGATTGATTSGTTGITTGATTATTGTSTGATTGGTVRRLTPISVAVVAFRCNGSRTTCNLTLRPGRWTTVTAGSLGLARSRPLVRRLAGLPVVLVLKPRSALRRGGRYTLVITLRASDGRTLVVRRVVLAH